MQELEQRINDLWSSVDDLELLGRHLEAEQLKKELFRILELMPKNEIFLRTIQ